MIYVGTCGYAYTDWLGSFYPGTTKRGEMLSYYTQCFSAVEIDASAYAILRPATVERMSAVTPKTFQFCFKAPQTLTHAFGGGRGAVHDEAAAFTESVMPIVQAEKLGCVLLQFPNSFRPTGGARDYLLGVIDALQPLRLVVEFRNREWQTASTHELLCELGVGWCNVDMPQFETLLHPSADLTCETGYVRFHGRNAAQWWSGTNTSRYDYDYRPEELDPWTTRVAELAEGTHATYAFFNNHARGNAPRNAKLFLEMLRDRYGSASTSVLPAAQPAVPVQRSLFEE